MLSPDAQNRAKRLFRKRKPATPGLAERAEDQFERNLIRRLGKLKPVRRFVAVWVLLCLVLIGGVVAQTRALSGYYQSMQPAPGGIYHEGIVGTYTNANPLYVTGQVNDAVSKLLFSGLFSYDQSNKLTGDLAETYTVDNLGTTYTVRLRPDLTWHDGRTLSSADVVFTYQTIQNPDAQSPLTPSWQNVVVSAPDARTVVFKLPNPLASFPHSLTTGIIPKHAFKDVKPANYRSLAFNTTQPIGSGPFRFKTIEVTGGSPADRQEEIELTPFEGYHGGEPALSSFVIHTYRDKEKMFDEFRDKTINAMTGAQDLPADIAEDKSIRTTVMPLTAANMVFFKTTQGVLADKAVRQALVGGSDVAEATKGLQQPVLPVRQPLLPGTPGFDPYFHQLSFGPGQANALLDQQGWVRGVDGIREKAGVKLGFKLYAQDSREYRTVAESLKRQWRQLGADVQVVLQEDADLRTTISGVGGAGGHAYDALLYGISLGVDPDGFVYWHSSQADVRSAARLNLSEYKSAVADLSLEDSRTRSDPALRAAKYKPFLQAWQQDAPALGLYQPRFTYVTRGQVFGLRDHTMTTDTDRFNNVADWMIRQTTQNIER